MTNKVFITGCDSYTSWMLPWFISNFKKHNPNIPLLIYDFGMKPEDAVKYGALRLFNWPNGDSQFRNFCAWFLKPLAIIETMRHYPNVVWLDTDCEILGNIEGIFKELKPLYLNLVEDKPWSMRTGEKWHNTGVIGVSQICSSLYDWELSCRVNNLTVRGDQEVLQAMKPTFNLNIHDLPNKYNWLRLQLVDGQDSPDKLIMHWTGGKGKEMIKFKTAND